MADTRAERRGWKRRVAASACLPVLGAVAGGLGPDVIVSDITSMVRYTPLSNITAYSAGSRACNIGDVPAIWHPQNNQHPIITQGMFRLRNGRFEQIGVSWCKHGFAAIQEGILCGNCVPAPDFTALGPGCSDPYTAANNGGQPILGPRFQVNANNGHFAYPYWQQGQSGSSIYKRLQVRTSDIDPTHNQGALYFVEAQYVTPDDAIAGNGLNNASFRQVSIPTVVATPTFVGPVEVQRSALEAWKDHDPGVTLVNVDFVEHHDVPTPSDVVARFIVAARATPNANGTWAYEYAVSNVNSHRSASALAVSVPCGLPVSAPGFHDVAYHSGDGHPLGSTPQDFDGTDWTPGRVPGGALRWAAVPAAQPENTNALRWGTLYNVRFVAPTPPTDGTLEITLFRPGAPGEPASVLATGLPVPSARACTPDFDGSGSVATSDVSAFLSAWFADLAQGTNLAGDFNCDGVVASTDLSAFLSAWFAALDGC